MKNQLQYIVTAVTLLLSHVLSAQAPGLGRAASFVIFSSTGAIANTSRTILTGNVGTNTGAITGFGNVNGVMHPPDTTTAGAKADLLIAYNQLRDAVPTFFPSVLMGNGQTYTAGVYSLGGNATIDLTLTLDGQGDPNSVFIFQIKGTLSSGTASKIVLTNGAQACNVFWKVEGAVSIGPGSTMRGNIVANNAAIEFMSSDTLEGRALSTTGQVSMDALTGSIPTGCGSTVLSGPVAPALASTACYALFSSTQNVVDLGSSSFVSGDIGTNSGSTVGYNPRNVNGTIHLLPDASTKTCDTDLAKVYTYLDTLHEDINLLYPADFGHNLVLTAHTYLLSAATALTDTLYLNADGNADAVFVIKVTGAFSTSTYAKVILTNGAQSKNVYWLVKGAVSLNNYADFKGTIIINGAVDLTTGVILDGRALTIKGAYSTASINAGVPAGTCATLPLSWLYFRGKAVQNNILLEWGTARESNNSFFTIEKSRNGNTFETLTTVPAGKTTSAAYYYSFTDRQPFPLSYYRISQTDINGHKDVFGIIKVNSAISKSFTVLHYVLDNYIYVKASNAAPGNGVIELYNMDGKKMSTQKVLLTQEENTYQIEKPIQKGMYLLYIRNNGERVYYGKVMVL